MAFHHGGALRGGEEASVPQCQSRRVGISGFQSGGLSVAWPPCAQRDVIMRAYHARTANARAILTHLDTVSELHLDEALAEAQHVWRNMRDGIPAHRPTPPCFRGLDAGFPGWMEMVTTNNGSAACARSEDHHLSCEGLIEHPLAIMQSGSAKTLAGELSGPGDPHHGPVLDTDVFVDCVRCPLGCAGSTNPTVCAVFVLGWLVG